MDPYIEQIRLSVELSFIKRRIKQILEDVEQIFTASIALNILKGQTNQYLSDQQKAELTELLNELEQKSEAKKPKLEQLWARRDTVRNRLQEIGSEGAWRGFDFE